MYNCRSKNSFFTDFFYICSICLNVILRPLPEVQCPNVLDFQNPWGESNGKKWTQILKLLLIKGVKSRHTKKFIFLANCAFLAGFFWYWCYYPLRSRDALSPVWGIFISISWLCRTSKFILIYLFFLWAWFAIIAGPAPDKWYSILMFLMTKTLVYHLHSLRLTFFLLINISGRLD